MSQHFTFIPLHTSFLPSANRSLPFAPAVTTGHPACHPYSLCTSFATSSRRRVARAQQQSPSPPSPESESESESNSSKNPFSYKFDPDSEVNAFGRDPKEETKFWMDSARDVLASQQVKDAIAEFTHQNPDNLTDDQRAYQQFIEKLDQDKLDQDPASST